MMSQKPPDCDTTTEDIHSERQRMAEKFGGDIVAILEDARKRQEASGRAVWQGPASPKAITPPVPTPPVSENMPSPDPT
jgi:hypothetical protein